MSSEIEELFDSASYPLSAEGAQSLETYLSLLLEWSRRINLTGFRDGRAVAEGLLFDAIELVPLIKEGATVLDVGAGAGGLSVALAVLRPDLELHLVEPRTKRAVFLRTVARKLDLASKLEVIQGRAETLPLELTEGIDVAFAQAVMPPAQWLGLGRSLVRRGGVILCLTARTLSELGVTVPCGLSIASERTYRRPYSKAPRVVTAFRTE